MKKRFENMRTFVLTGPCRQEEMMWSRLRLLQPSVCGLTSAASNETTMDVNKW